MMISEYMYLRTTTFTSYVAYLFSDMDELINVEDKIYEVDILLLYQLFSSLLFFSSSSLLMCKSHDL